MDVVSIGLGVAVLAIGSQLVGSEVLVVLGLWLAYQTAIFVWACFLRPGKNLKKAYGEWAVVTGATDGIGKAMAAEMSKKGMKVLLISRDPTRLADSAKEMAGETEVLCIDYSDFSEAKRAQVAKALEGKEIGVLVNNVGISYDHPEYFHLLDDDRINKLIALNVESTTWMTKLVLDNMLERKKGAVVNMASLAAKGPSALLAQYCAAKNYVVGFSNALHAEYKSKGVDFQVQVPLWITTKLAKVRRASMTTPTPEVYAKAAVKCIGFERETSPYFAHWLILGLMKGLPLFIQDMMMNSMHLGVRKAAYRKFEKPAKGFFKKDFEKK